MNKWKDVKDELPTDYDWYLVSVREQTDLGAFNYTDILSWGNIKGLGDTWFLGAPSQTVIAWQERPTPYQPEEL